jgi:hypothetical protein
VSRPPRFRAAYTTTGNPMPNRRTLDYMSDEFADFVEMQRGLASEQLGFPASTAQGDFAGTLMELSALIAHVLGIYQDRNADEAFIGTAQSQKSLVRHGRRLAYEPSPGLSATGHAVFTAKAGPSGLIPPGFALSSAPVGEKKAQEYETLDDLAIDPDHNEMLPDAKTETIALAGATSFTVAGVALRIQKGEVVVLQVGSGDFMTSAVQVHALEVTDVVEDAMAKTTTLTVHQLLPAVSFDGAKLLAKPASRSHLFAWDTSPNDFPDGKLAGGLYPQGAAEPPAPGQTNYGYGASPSYSDNDIYLADELKKKVLAQPVVCIDASGATAFKVAGETPVSVVFVSKTHVQITITMPDPTPASVIDTYPTIQASRSVTALQVQDNAGAVQKRTAQAIRTSQWLLDWGVTASLVTTRPNTTPLGFPLTLERSVSGLAPGQLVALATLAGKTPAITEVARLTFVADVAGKTTVNLAMVDPASGGHAWTLGELRLRGNVVPISHGKTVSEILGDSDGVTPFLRFQLKQKPLTHLPGSNGAEPALEIRVNDVLWSLVDDFEDSTEHDLHYLTQRDETGTTYVIFGNGQKGAVPAVGTNIVAAAYRIGVGRNGNADPLAVSKIKKSHPLVDKAENPRAVVGGSDAAALEDVRVQATTYIETFDRAVSVDDHMNLALRYPGIVKANAFWTELSGTNVEGVKVIVADAEGNAPAIDQITAFLQARRDDTVPLEVTGTTPIGLFMRVQLEIDPAHDVEIVKRAVRAALTDESVPGLFTFAGRDIGEPAFLSEIYDRVVAVDGVRFVQVWHFDTLAEVQAQTPVRVLDTVVVRPDEWLELSPQNLDFAPAPEASP